MICTLLITVPDSVCLGAKETKAKRINMVLRRIIRGDEVKLEGQVTLHLKQPPKATQSSSPKLANQFAKAVSIENNPEFAVIEVTCRCGEKMYLRCEYADFENSQTSKELEGVGTSAKTEINSQ